MLMRRRRINCEKDKNGNSRGCLIPDKRYIEGADGVAFNLQGAVVQIIKSLDEEGNMGISGWCIIHLILGDF